MERGYCVGWHQAMVFGLTIWASCIWTASDECRAARCESAAVVSVARGIISSPCNEWRGYTLQPPDKKLLARRALMLLNACAAEAARLPFNIYFKPINYARSTGFEREHCRCPVEHPRIVASSGLVAWVRWLWQQESAPPSWASR